MRKMVLAIATAGGVGLLPFAPGAIAPASLGARWGAFIIDYITLILPLWVLLSLLRYVEKLVLIAMDVEARAQ